MLLPKNKQIFITSKKAWEVNNLDFPGTNMKYPDESLIRLFLGSYINISKPPAVLMDHGFGDANNLVFFANLGYKCVGCEISEYYIKQAKKLFKILKKPVDFKLLKGLKLPFKDKSIDIIISWNVIHYNGTLPAVKKTIAEFYRILKPKGILLLSTISPKNSLIKRMKPLGKKSYKIYKKSNYDNRHGLTFFVAKSTSDLSRLFLQFSKVKKGEVYSNLFNPQRKGGWFLIYAVK